MDNAIGLVMTGGGARGAYQAGVLKRIGEIKRIETYGNPFPLIGGASAGARAAPVLEEKTLPAAAVRRPTQTMATTTKRSSCTSSASGYCTWLSRP